MEETLQPDLTTIVNALDRLTQAQAKGWLDYVSFLAVILTLLVLIWYTVETYKLRKAAQNQITVAQNQLDAAHAQAMIAQEQLRISQVQVDAAAMQLAESQRQTENANRPIIIVRFETITEGSITPTCLVYRNIGTAPAFSVRCNKFIYGSGYFLLESVMLVPQDGITKTALVLFNKEERALWATGYFQGIRDWFHSNGMDDTCHFIISYKSADGNAYFTSCSMHTPINPNCFDFGSYDRAQALSDVSMP